MSKKRPKEESVQFEKALARLEEIVGDLESGGLSLDEAIKRYEEGSGLIALCQKRLSGAERKIELLVKKGAGDFSTKKFDEEEPEEKKAEDNVLF